MEPDSITPVAQIEAEASMENWEMLIDFVKDQAAAALPQGRQFYGMLLASEELLSNVVRQSETHPPREGVVTVRIVSQRRDCAGEHWFDLLISDDGAPFDPQLDSLQAPPVDAPIHERPVGGLGLFLVKTSVDRVHYCLDGGRNSYCLSSQIQVS